AWQTLGALGQKRVVAADSFSCSEVSFSFSFFFLFKQKTAYEIGLGIPAEPLSDLFLMSSLMLLLVWLIFFMVLIKLLPILGTISGKTVKLMVLALICLGNNRQD